jgi:hypothetical protein
LPELGQIEKDQYFEDYILGKSIKGGDSSKSKIPYLLLLANIINYDSIYIIFTNHQYIEALINEVFYS